MIDNYLPEIAKIQSEGGIVLIKWDGERTQRQNTVVITRSDTDYVWRKDCDDVSSTLAQAISDYQLKHAK